MFWEYSEKVLKVKIVFVFGRDASTSSQCFQRVPVKKYVCVR